MKRVEQRLKNGFVENKGQSGPFSVDRKTQGNGSQLNFRLFVNCQLKSWPFVSCQLTPSDLLFSRLTLTNLAFEIFRLPNRAFSDLTDCKVRLLYSV